MTDIAVLCFTFINAPVNHTKKWQFHITSSLLRIIATNMSLPIHYCHSCFNEDNCGIFFKDFEFGGNYLFLFESDGPDSVS